MAARTRKTTDPATEPATTGTDPVVTPHADDGSGTPPPDNGSGDGTGHGGGSVGGTPPNDRDVLLDMATKKTKAGVTKTNVAATTTVSMEAAVTDFDTHKKRTVKTSATVGLSETTADEDVPAGS